MRKEQNFKWNQLELGTCYYPEHWDRSLWAEDLRRMKDNGIFTIRIAEFAWNLVEPREGVFTFDFFDEFLDVAEAEGMKVIFGTPTATPPAWLTEKYPEVLNCRVDGVKYRHGMRRHYNYNAPIYRELSARIVEKEAEHYAKRSCIIGWQIDNELNCETDEFYSDSDSVAFRTFLKEKYGTLDALNKAWGTIVWNQTYIDWNEIYVPRPTIQNNTTNLHQVLDYSRFVSASAISFCKMQSDIIRKYLKPGDFITTNGMFGNLDNHKMTDDALDVYTYDSYPNFAYCLIEDPDHNKDLNDRKWSKNLMEVRSICPHFGIMEQQSGANGWNSRMEAPSPKPGQLMLWAMQSVAHGADYVSFFRWRTATVGTEIYWHGILNYDNRDNRKLREVHDFYERISKISDMAGAEYKATFAVLKDYDNEWDARVDVWHSRIGGRSEKEIFAAAQINHVPFDFLYLRDDTELEELKKYPVLFYPHAMILTEERAELLKQYVAEGGTLIIGARTGMKDADGHCVMMPMPGLFASMTKTDVEDFTFVGPADHKVDMTWNGKTLSSGLFNDVLHVDGPDAKVLATYAENYYKGAPALVETPFGEGKVLHFGGTFTRDNVKEFFSHVGILEPYADVLTLPKDCELAVRTKNGETLFFVMNFAWSEQEIRVNQALTDVDDGSAIEGVVTLKPFEVKIYKA